MKGRYHLVSKTPEMERVRANQKHISSVQYREEVGHGTPVKDTPEMERVRRNQENISSVSRRHTHTHTPTHSVRYQRGLQELRGRSCSELDTPEYRRVRRTQDSVSMVAARGSSTPGICGLTAENLISNL
uniref:Uncharacterized protein n=1 Tax=Xiphophorus maculatus TaxID=8083 RepID=A0A3B5PW72_XIPMA